MRILVTGATGFMAQHLVPALAGEHEVVALGHDRARIVAAPGAEPLELDLRELGYDRKLPQVDAIVHLAQANVPFPDGARDLFAVNTASTVALLEHARRSGASHFVYASSGSVYGFGEHVVTETSELSARDFYGASKIAGERFVCSYSGLLSTAVLRFFFPYGPGQRDRLIPALVDRVRDGRPVTLNGGGRPRMNPIFVDDIVATLEAVLERDGDMVLNVAGPDTTDVRGVAELAAELLQVAPVFETGDATAAGDLVADTSRLRALLGDRSLVPLRDGLRAVVGSTVTTA